MNEYKDLGWQNGWDWSEEKLSYEYQCCCDARHLRREENIGKNQWQVFCDTCCITWKYDSGD